MKWAERAIWISLSIGLGPACSSALHDANRVVQRTASSGLWALWAIGLVASLVPSTVSLTIVRFLAPGTFVVAIAAWVAGAGPVLGALGTALAVATIVVVFSAEFGQIFVQASAYGDESRFPLRPPGALVFGPLPLVWIVVVGMLSAGVLLLHRALPVALVMIAVGGAGCWIVAKRCHRLTQRYIVLVPAGLVVHDAVGLAETAMFRSGEVRKVSLATADTRAADLTAGALGMAVEIELREMSTVVLAGVRRADGTKALHVRSILVAPSRPGRLLAEVARRGHQVASAPPSTKRSDAS